MSDREKELRDNILFAKEQIKQAALSSGRQPEDIKLLAVSKTRPEEDILFSIKAGQLDFGENRPQELVRKFDAIADKNVRWHLIGQLQKNKVKYIINKVSLIHSLSTESSLLELERLGEKNDVITDCLLEVNTSLEDSKSGVAIEDAECFLEKASKMSFVRIKGMMTIAPYGTDNDNARPYFAELRELSERLSGYFPGKAILSMGMSGDYIAAIKEGSDIVRIGTAIFGKRDIK